MLKGRAEGRVENWGEEEEREGGRMGGRGRGIGGETEGRSKEVEMEGGVVEWGRVGAREEAYGAGVTERGRFRGGG